MVRKFKFEAEIYRTLELVPLAVRRKLDRAGFKVGLEQWQAMDRGERLALCHLPVESSEELEAFDVFVREAVRSHCGAEPGRLSDDKRAVAEPPAEAPTELVSRAQAEGFSIGASEWKRLDADQRYALMKLGAGAKVSHDLRAALEEFLGAR